VYFEWILIHDCVLVECCYVFFIYFFNVAKTLLLYGALSGLAMVQFQVYSSVAEIILSVFKHVAS